MTFQDPSFLWFLLLLIVPLVLYLLPMPRRRIAASALYLWERFLASERFGRTSERLRRALGFALLAAILLCLTLAAAELTVGSTEVRSPKVVVLLDSSASMNAVVNGRSNFDRAKDAAATLAGGLGGGTQVALAESAQGLKVVSAMSFGGREGARLLRSLERFDGPADMGRSLQRAFELWGDDQQVELYTFSDAPLPVSAWGARAHAWIAPRAGDNIGITELTSRRRGAEIELNATIANYGSASRQVSGALFVNGAWRKVVGPLSIPAGGFVRHTIQVNEPAYAEFEIRLEDLKDSLATDDSAWVAVPALDLLRVAVIWPEAATTRPTMVPASPVARRNDYVWAVLSALKQEGLIGEIVEGETGSENAAAKIYVNHSPATWPDSGGVIILHPLRSGALSVRGLHPEQVTVDRQVADPLLADVDLRGLQAQGVVLADVPTWARSLAWAQEMPLIWAGSPPQSRANVLFVGLPILPAGSRLPLVTGFPVLMRNALASMLPMPQSARPGEYVDGLTSRRVGVIAGKPARAFSTLSAAESDLRRAEGIESALSRSRRSLAGTLVMIALLLLCVEWGTVSQANDGVIRNGVFGDTHQPDAGRPDRGRRHLFAVDGAAHASALAPVAIGVHGDPAHPAFACAGRLGSGPYGGPGRDSGHSAEVVVLVDRSTSVSAQGQAMADQWIAHARSGLGDESSNRDRDWAATSWRQPGGRRSVGGRCGISHAWRTAVAVPVRWHGNDGRPFPPLRQFFRSATSA